MDRMRNGAETFSLTSEDGLSKMSQLIYIQMVTDLSLTHSS